MLQLRKKIYSINSSIKLDTICYTIGSLCSSGSSVLLLVYVTRILGTDEAGIYSIAYSIATLMWTIGCFGTRQFQVSDIKEKYSFSDYLNLKILLSFVVIIGGFIYSLFLHSTGYKLLISIIYCFLILADVFADVFAGRFQQIGKLYIAGISYMIRIVGYNLLFLITLLLFKSLPLSLLISIAYSYIFLYLFDYKIICSNEIVVLKPNFKKISQICISCAPIFLASFLATMMVNIPKNYIDLQLSNEIQAYYGYIMMPSNVVGLFCSFIFVPMYTSIAKEWANNNKANFNKILFRVFLYLIGIIIFVLTAGYFLGIPVLDLIYGVDLSSAKLPFMILLIAGCVTSYNSVLQYIITVMRVQKYIIIAYVLGTAICQFSINYLITNYGLLGAAFNYLLGMGIISIVFTFIVIRNYRIENTK